jgi:hypothetical protein
MRAFAVITAALVTLTICNAIFKATGRRVWARQTLCQVSRTSD